MDYEKKMRSLLRAAQEDARREARAITRNGFESSIGFEAIEDMEKFGLRFGRIDRMR